MHNRIITFRIRHLHYVKPRYTKFQRIVSANRVYMQRGSIDNMDDRNDSLLHVVLYPAGKSSCSPNQLVGIC